MHIRNHIFTGKDIEKPYKEKTNYGIHQRPSGFSAGKEEVLVIAAYYDLTTLGAYRPNGRIGHCPVHLHPLLAR